MSHGTGRIAKRYARAMFDSVAQTELDNLRNALNALATVWTSTSDLKIALLNPSLTAEHQQKLAGEIANLIKPGDKELRNLISLLMENKRISLIPEVANQFSSLVDEFKAAMTIEVTSAFEVPLSEKADYEEKIRKDVGALAQIEWRVDKEILGGMLIKSGDKLIDSSVKGSLRKIASQLLA